VQYDAEAEVDGALGAVGSRLLAAFGRRVVERFLAGVDDAIAGASPESELQQGGTADVQLQQGGTADVQLQQGGTADVQLQQGGTAATPRTLAAFALGLVVGLWLGRRR